MAKKPNGAKDRKGKPVRSPAMPNGDVPDGDVPDGDVLGDLVDSDFDIRVEDDGKVQIHARCREDEDAAASAQRMRFLVEALGGDFLPPPDLPR